MDGIFEYLFIFYVCMKQNVYMKVRQGVVPCLQLVLMFYVYNEQVKARNNPCEDILVHEDQRLDIIISQILNRYVCVFFLFFVLRILHLYLLDTARQNYLQELKLKKKSLVSQCIFIILVTEEY